MVVPGAYPPGKRNSISDVEGVTVGHCTRIEGDGIRTGVTVISPHHRDPFRFRAPCATVAGNAYGKLAGSQQIDELGELESPIGLTNTLSIAAVMQGLVNNHLKAARPEAHLSVNVLVGETNDRYLNDISSCAVTPDHVEIALENLSADFEEGAVGAGTGTACFGYKGGIGTASRIVPGGRNAGDCDYRIGVLVQTNYGGALEVYGRPLPNGPGSMETGTGGSCMIVVATDAPVDSRQLKRFGRRGIHALGRTGSYMAHGSGDFCIAFSTSNLRDIQWMGKRTVVLLNEESLSTFFAAVVEAVTEALYNSMTMAKTTAGYRGRVLEGIDLNRFRDILPLK